MSCYLPFFNSGVCKAEAEKRNNMSKKSGLKVRCVKKANEKYVAYREYHRDKVEIDESELFPKG